jgi:hypothetical protein
MKETEMEQIADFLQLGLSGYSCGGEVVALIGKHRTAHYSFDDAKV